jgi:hypothetical protein
MVEVNKKHSFHLSPFMRWACYYYNHEIIDFVAEAAKTPEERFDCWNEGLAGACAANDLELAQEMIDKGAWNIMPALERACKYDAPECIEFLLGRVKCTQDYLDELMPSACKHGIVSSAIILYEHGARFDGNSVWDLIVNTKEFERAVDFTIDKLELDAMRILRHLVGNYDLSRFVFLARKYDLDDCDVFGLLRLACAQNSDAIADFILEEYYGSNADILLESAIRTQSGGLWDYLIRSGNVPVYKAYARNILCGLKSLKHIATDNATKFMEQVYANNTGTVNDLLEDILLRPDSEDILCEGLGIACNAGYTEIILALIEAGATDCAKCGGSNHPLLR